MTEIKPIEIINNNTEIINNNTEIINDIFEDKPIDRRKKNKKVVDEPVDKIDKRTIKRALWRYITLEDGSVKYNKHPIDINYYKKYYDEKRKAIDAAIITCELCNRHITSGHIHRHQRSNICKKNYNLRLNTDEKPSEETL